MTLDQIRQGYADFMDHEVFCRECLSIRDESGSVVPLVLSPGQIKQGETIRRQRKAGKPVRLVILKPRRTFFTVGSCAQMFHQIPFFPGRKGLIIADKYDPAALEAFDYFLQFQRGYRPFKREGTEILLPKLVKDNEQEMKWANESAIQVLSAEGGELRGAGRHCVLLDEVAFWRKADVTLTGVLNMVGSARSAMVAPNRTVRQPEYVITATFAALPLCPLSSEPRPAKEFGGFVGERTIWSVPPVSFRAVTETAFMGPLIS